MLGLTRRGIVVRTARRLILVGAAFPMASSIVLTPLFTNDVVSLAFLFAATFGMAGWNSNYLSFVEELYPQKVSAVAGLIGSAGAFAGAITLWLFGVVSQATGSFTAVFMMVAVMICLATAGILFSSEPRSQPARGLPAGPMASRTST